MLSTSINRPFLNSEVSITVQSSFLRSHYIGLVEPSFQQEFGNLWEITQGAMLRPMLGRKPSKRLSFTGNWLIALAFASSAHAGWVIQKTQIRKENGLETEFKHKI